MNDNSHLHHSPNALSEPDQRYHPRYQVDNALVITSHGIFQIRNISLGGFSLTSTFRANDQNVICFDLLDTNGDHIQDLEAEIIWKEKQGSGKDEEPFYYAAGASFKDLTPVQYHSLKNIISSCPS